MCIGVSQEMMRHEAEFTVGPENQMELCGEAENPSSSKEKMSMDLLSVKQEEEGGYSFGASSVSMEHGKNDCSHLLFMVLPSRVWILPPPLYWSCSHQSH